MHTNASPSLAAGKSGLLFALLLSIVCLAGCMSQSPEMSSGNPIDSAKVAQIVKGKTTRAEVEGLLGKPDATSLLPDGRRTLVYNYSNTKMAINAGAMMLSAMTGKGGGANGTTRTQSLQIYVTKEGTVEDYEFSDTSRDINGSGNGSVRSTTR
jgi:outer membrane protein assembly factor BamE (lipoprotein component of BamABCDE complex)